MIDQEILCHIWLTSVFGCGSKHPVQLIKKYGSAYNAVTAGKEELLFGMEAGNFMQAFKNPDFTYAKYILDKCKNDAVSILCYHDEAYPKLLKEIPNPPAVLFYRGDISLLEKMPFTVVGRRKMNAEGKQILDLFVPALKKAGFTIVAGFAEGAEAALHRNYDKTVAVLPCGINVNYPKSNAGLKREIVEKGGLVITEYMHDVNAYKSNFYLRNRLLAGLSYGVLVTQAGAKSGTSITATAAGDYGRQVYAVPGSILDVSFKGCNEMIRMGATPVTEPNHIVADYAPLYDAISTPVTAEGSAPGVLNLIDSKYSGLNEDELAILKCISGGRVHPDEITIRTGIDISMVNSVLTLLQMQEIIVETDGLYSII